MLTDKFSLEFINKDASLKQDLAKTNLAQTQEKFKFSPWSAELAAQFIQTEDETSYDCLSKPFINCNSFICHLILTNIQLSKPLVVQFRWSVLRPRPEVLVTPWLTTTGVAVASI